MLKHILIHEKKPYFFNSFNQKVSAGENVTTRYSMQAVNTVRQRFIQYGYLFNVSLIKIYIRIKVTCKFLEKRKVKFNILNKSYHDKNGLRMSKYFLN